MTLYHQRTKCHTSVVTQLKVLTMMIAHCIKVIHIIIISRSIVVSPRALPGGPAQPT